MINHWEEYDAGPPKGYQQFLLRNKNIIQVKKVYKKHKKYKVPKNFRVHFAVNILKRNIYVKKHFKNLLIIKQSLKKFFGQISNAQLLKIKTKIKRSKIGIDKFFQMFTPFSITGTA